MIIQNIDGRLVTTRYTTVHNHSVLGVNYTPCVSICTWRCFNDCSGNECVSDVEDTLWHYLEIIVPIVD